MPDVEPVNPSPAGMGEGIAPAGGQAGAAPAAPSTPPASDQPRRPTADPTEQPSTPARESGLGWKSLEDAERDYKALQSYTTKVSQSLKAVGDLSAVQQEREILAQLREDPEFIDWVKARLAKEQAGSEDPETVKALEIIDQRARQIAAEAVAPLRAAHIEQKTRTIFGEMDKKYGAEWQTHKAAMNELHQRDIKRGIVSPRADQNFDFDYVEGLYRRIVASDPDYAATQYQKRLAQKHAQSTVSQPGTAPSAVGLPKARTLEEAYANAKRQHGL